MLPLIEGVSKLEPELGDDPFLGHGKITVTDMEVETPASTPCRTWRKVYIDRRVTFGETVETALAQVRKLVPQQYLADGSVTVEMMKYDEPSTRALCSPWTSTSRRGAE